jgi:hypothetical protein
MDEEGWQPLISLGWSDKEEYQKAAAASFANLRMRGLQAAACIREGGLRCLLHLLQVRFYSLPLDACTDAFAVMQRGANSDVKLLACVAITRMCSDKMVVKPMIACVDTSLLAHVPFRPVTCIAQI